MSRPSATVSTAHEPGPTTSALAFPDERVSYSPLPGWTDRRPEECKGYVDALARAKCVGPAEGEVFLLEPPRGSDFINVGLTTVHVPPDTNPVAALQLSSDALREALAKGGFALFVVASPRPIRSREGVSGAELRQRKQMPGGWSRDAERLFVRGDRAYVVTVTWNDQLGEDPPDLQRALDGLRFEP